MAEMLISDPTDLPQFCVKDRQVVPQTWNCRSGRREIRLRVEADLRCNPIVSFKKILASKDRENLETPP
jgi:hypothetical protein